MMRLVTVASGVELEMPDEVNLEIDSPYFQADAIPGTVTLPFDLVWTRQNLQGLDFPHLFRGPGGPAPIEVDAYVENTRWRRGKLVYLSVDVQAQRLRYNFVADAADLATAIQDVKLDTLDLGTAPLSTGKNAFYALNPVKNSLFYGDADKAPTSYSGYLNYAPGGQYLPGAVLAPQPYLVPLLRQVLGCFGYEAVGPWLDELEVQNLCVYSDRLATDPTTVTLNRHVPVIDVADLLLGLQGLFCLGIYINPNARQLRFTALRDVLPGMASPRVGAWQSATANTTNGFALSQKPDSNDELDKSLDTGWQKFTLGAGGESQEVKAGTLHMVVAPMSKGGPSWQVPAYEAKGAVPGNTDVGDESRVGLRLLFDRGYQPASDGSLYPLGSALATNLAGQVVGHYSLQWEGAAGLYAQWHQAWLAFRARAVQHVYQSEFRVADLLTLDPDRADLVDYHHCLWEKVSVTIAASSPLTTATFTYQELL
jgi:hypothetical protein